MKNDIENSPCSKCGSPILINVLTDDLFKKTRRHSETFKREDLIFVCRNDHIRDVVTCRHNKKLMCRTAGKNAKKYPNQKYYSCYIYYKEPECCRNIWYSQKEVQEKFNIDIGTPIAPLRSGGDSTKLRQRASNGVSKTTVENRSVRHDGSETTFNYLNADKEAQVDNQSQLSSRMNQSEQSLPLSLGISNVKYGDYYRGHKTIKSINGQEKSNSLPVKTSHHQYERKPHVIKTPVHEQKKVKTQYKDVSNNDFNRNEISRYTAEQASVDAFYRDIDDHLRQKMQICDDRISNTTKRLQNVKHISYKTK